LYFSKGCIDINKTLKGKINGNLVLAFAYEMITFQIFLPFSTCYENTMKVEIIFTLTA